MKSFNDNALIVHNKHISPLNILVHAIRREQNNVVVIEKGADSNIGIYSSDGLLKTIEMVEFALSDLRSRLDEC